MSVAPVLSRAVAPSTQARPPGPGRVGREAVVIPFPGVCSVRAASGHRVGLTVAAQHRVGRAAQADAPSDRPRAERAGPALRLTRRGRVVLAAAVLVAGVLAGWLGARVVRVQATVPGGAPAVVEVRPGDTLWGIARRVAPQADPRAVVDQLQRRNGLINGTVRPGQRLAVRP